jgi:hypothetical protein
MSTQSQPPTTQSPLSTDALRRQLRALKVLVILLVLALLGGAGYVAYERHLGQPMIILVGGKPVATVRNAAAANHLLTEAEAAAIGPAYAGQSPIRLQPVLLRRAPTDAVLNTDSSARDRLVQALNLRVHAWLIIVSGKPSIGLPTQEIADETLQIVKQHFAQMPPQAQIVGEPSFLQSVSVVPKAIALTRAHSNAQTAAPYFWTPPPSKTYIVKLGDTGYKIAMKNHIAFSDFLTANQGKDLNHLQPGDVVNVQRMPLLLSVRVRKTFTSDLPVLPDGPMDERGLQRVTYVVTYVDGRETARTVSNAVILKKPPTQSEL